MLGPLRRLGCFLTGGVLSTCALAVMEATSVRGHLELVAAEDVSLGRLVAFHVGVLVPAAVLIAGAVFVVASLVATAGIRSWLMAPEPERRATVASFAPLSVVGAFVWMVGTAHAARAMLGRGAPLETGAHLAIASLLILAIVATASLALAPVGARLLARRPARATPVVTTSVALALVAAVFAFGVLSGEPSGARGVLGIFGVLRRAELDLRPVFHASLVGAGAWVLGALLDVASRAGRVARRRVTVAGVTATVVLASGLLVWTSGALNAVPEVAGTLREHAPLAGKSLAALQRASDRDGDRYSALFGGGDCDDHDSTINPAAVDIPGNGIDEDCSGADTPLVAAAENEPSATGSELRRTYNVILITIDALRFDLGYMGHPRPISPSLDALAARSSVFERAYATASMTWQSVGALLIGRYPSENGGFERFNHFVPQNVTVTERLHERGVRTFAAMCQFAFSKPHPRDVPRNEYVHIGHGFDVWDTSADPNPDGYNYEDDAVTSDKLTDAAIALMSAPENVSPSGRFFAWFHYFDPHTQYVLHPEAPDFTTDDKSEIGRDRAVYESEVWYADHHVGRLISFVASQPWGKDTAIIVTGDHGEAFGEHGMRWHRKELWEELMRVPLIIHVPGQKPNRVKVRRSHIDVARTILELAGVPPPEDGSLRGESLVADVLSPDDHVPRERDVYAEIVPSENPLRRVLITGPGHGMKIVHRGGQSYELYDLDKDPGEKTNLANKRDLLEPAIERLQQFRAGLEEIPWTPPPKR